MFLNHPVGTQQVFLHKTLNENPKTRERDLEIIKQWLVQQPHLPNKWDEHCLLTFLRGCKFSLETCKRKLDMYFRMRAEIPEFFTNRDIKRPELQAVWELGDAAVLPELTPDGSRVSILRTSKSDFETPNLANLFKIVFMVGDIRLKVEEGVTDTFIFDLNFPIIKHLINAVTMNPTALKKFFVCVHEAYPVVIEEVHLINAPPYVDVGINMLKPFLGETLRQCIHVHTTIETLFEFVPKDILPEDYGGKGCKLIDLKKKWYTTLEEYSSWFKEQEEFKATESKKITLHENLFGVNGTFRNLCID